MFADFFLELKRAGVPVSFTAYLNLQRALYKGLIISLNSFYHCARSILVKSERHFDAYDRIFAYHFEGADESILDGIMPDEKMAALLELWLREASDPARQFDSDSLDFESMTPDELLQYFKDRLEEQKEKHDGGTKWIGTSGTSPTGHSGCHVDGMRVGGTSTSRSAMKVAGERRYRDYSDDVMLSEATMMEALKKLKIMVPHGPKDRLDIDATIYQTMRNAGEIELVFSQSLRDRLKVILMIDNGGFSMDPHIGTVKKLFDHAHSFFKDLNVYYFHNTIYRRIWSDPQRFKKPVPIEDFSGRDPETRLIIVGDASMSPYELLYRNGVIRTEDRENAPGLEYLKQLASMFRHTVWLNPVPDYLWQYTSSIGIIRDIFPMYDISMKGLENAVTRLMS